MVAAGSSSSSRAIQGKRAAGGRDAAERTSSTGESGIAAAGAAVAKRPGSGTATPGSSRASSPYPLSASNEILGMLAAPGGMAKLPNFKRKTAAASTGTSNEAAKSTAMSKKGSASTTASTSTSASTRTKAEKPKKAPASTKKPSSKQKSSAGSGTATPTIEWTSSEEDEEEIVTVRRAPLDKGKGKARASNEDVTTKKHEGGRSVSASQNSQARGQQRGSLQPEGASATSRASPPGSATQEAIHKAHPPGRPPDQAIPSEHALDPSSPIPPPYKTLSQPTTRNPSPVTTVPPSVASADNVLSEANANDSDDSEDLDQGFAFDLDSQIQAALSGGGSSAAVPHDQPEVVDRDAPEPDAAAGSDPALAAIDRSQDPDQTVMAARDSDEESEDDAFDFDKQIAAAMGSASEAKAASGESAGSQPAPVEAADSDGEEEEEGFDLDNALAAAADSAQAGSMSAIPGQLSAAVRTADAPAVTVDAGSDDDSDDEVFDLDKQLAAAIQPATASTAAIVSVTAKQDASKSDDDDDDLFDFDKHLAAAMSATPSAGVALLSAEVDPALQALLASPAKASSSALPESDLPSSHLNAGTLGSSSIMQQIIPLPSPLSSDDDDESEAADETAFDLNAMLANAMDGQAARDKQEKDAAASLAADIQQTLGQAFASAAVAAELDSDSEAFSSAIGAEDDDDDGEDVEMTFDLDAQLQAAMSGKLERWGDDVESTPVPGLDLNLQAPSFAESNALQASDDSDDSDDDGEQAGFDLDAHIGAAMRSVSVDDSRQSPFLQNATNVPGSTQAAGLQQSDLQAMLSGAMRQAALEVELDIDDADQPEFDELMEYDEEKDLSSGIGQPVVPGMPRMRPDMRDNGDAGNAFNMARKANPQALHTFYACDLPGCDRVFAKMKNRDKHRAMHNQGPGGSFPCPRCPLRFASLQDSQDHLLTHNATREWRYRCSGCHNLFATKAMLDRHAYAAATAETTSLEIERCRKGAFTLAFLPLRKTHPKLFPLPMQGGADHLQPPSLPAEPNFNPFFEKTKFDSGPLLAATLVSQLSSLIAQQYDRQNALRLPSDPPIDIPLAMSQTIKRANLSSRECAALASILATVGHARNEGLKASLGEARKVQIENLRRQHEHQDKIRDEIARREAEKQRMEQERRERMEADKRERAKARREALIGDIPVPQAEIPVPQS